MTFRPRIARLPLGLQLPYVSQGDPSGIPVLFLHGITDSWRSFEPVLPQLPDSLYAMAMTQRGHGDASRPTSGYRIGDLAEDVAAFLDEMGIENALIVGHSMGSSVALRFALDYPDRTLGLVLAGAFAGYRGNPAVQHFIRTEIAPLRDPIDRELAHAFQISTLAKAIAPDFLDMVVKESLKVPARVWRAAFEGLADDDFYGRLGRVTTPTLVIWGDRDLFSPYAEQQRLCRSIPGSHLKTYVGCGHALHWEEPVRFARDVAAHAMVHACPA